MYQAVTLRQESLSGDLDGHRKKGFYKPSYMWKDNVVINARVCDIIGDVSATQGKNAGRYHLIVMLG